MNAHTGTMAVSWADWLRRWDAQQCVYIEDRERCFKVMFSFIEALLPPEVTVLDLACGPGAISQRLLRRLPGARSVAVDVDPVLLGLGQGPWATSTAASGGSEPISGSLAGWRLSATTASTRSCPPSRPTGSKPTS
ncbi:MAG: class I SAM-dependent methyltransferase [Egibacteraceae bacterium]